MRCLVLVKFLPGGSIPPAEFFRRMKAQWSYVKDLETQVTVNEDNASIPSASLAKAGICITDYDSIEQLTMDLTIMPGAGISNVEVVLISDETDFEQISSSVLSNKAGQVPNRVQESIH